MTHTPLYLASTGIITAIGANTAMTAPSVNTGISGYSLSDYDTQDDEPITMVLLPEAVFRNLQADITESSRFNLRHDHIIKMAIIALREACGKTPITQAIPTLLALPADDTDQVDFNLLYGNLANNLAPWLDETLARIFQLLRFNA